MLIEQAIREMVFANNYEGCRLISKNEGVYIFVNETEQLFLMTNEDDSISGCSFSILNVEKILDRGYSINDIEHIFLTLKVQTGRLSKIFEELKGEELSDFSFLLSSKGGCIMKKLSTKEFFVIVLNNIFPEEILETMATFPLIFNDRDCLLMTAETFCCEDENLKRTMKKIKIQFDEIADKSDSINLIVQS